MSDTSGSASSSLHQPKRYDCLLATVIFRPIARVITPLLARTAITPNQVTVIALLFALGSAACFWTTETQWSLLGSALLFVAYALDVTDGALARLTGQTSDLGLHLDPILDRIGETAILLAVAVGYFHSSGSAWPLYILGTGSSTLLIYFYIVDIRPKGKGVGQRDDGRVLSSKTGTYVGLIDLYYGGAMIAGLVNRLDLWGYGISVVAFIGMVFQLAVLPRRVQEL